MRALLIFPPGWMQFGPYLSLPLLKGYAASRGIDIDILDLNIAFYDWLLSPATLHAVGDRLEQRMRTEGSALSGVARARLCKAALTHEYLAGWVDDAKATLRDPERYQDDAARELAKRHICSALGAVAVGFPGLTITPSTIGFANCGLDPERVVPFLDSEANIISWFHRDQGSALLGERPYDFIGFSLPAWEQLVPTLTLVRHLRRGIGANAHICMGGNFTTRMVGTWHGRPHPFAEMIDSFSVFDGERSLVELLAALDQGQPLDGVSNLVVRDGDELRRTATHDIDIDTIPAPDFDGLELSSYLAPEPILPLYTSRSCPYKCSFCTIPYASSGFRERAPERVVDDLESLQSRYRARFFSFVDETLTVPTLRGCAQEIERRGLDIRWYGETRFHPKLDETLCRQLFRSGCRKLQFGVESYNQRILNAMKKGVKLDIIGPNLDACLSAGIAVHLFTFYGFPGEEEHEARRTHEFAQSILTRSREVFGNPYSSVGSGTFNLEAYSDVYHRPQLYGVRLRGQASFFEVDYQVERGMSRKRAEELAQELNNVAVFRDLCRISGQIWWQALSGMETNEDEAFLLYCLRSGAASTHAASDEARDLAPIQQLTQHGHRRRLGLADGVLMREFDDDFGGWRDAPSRPVMCFYDPRRDIFVNTSAHTGRFLRYCLARGFLPETLDSNLCDTINRLLRHRMLEVSGGGVYESALRAHADGILRWNPDVAIYQVRDERLELFNTLSQTLTSLDPASALIASMTQKPGMTVERIRERVRDELPGYPEDRVPALLDDLVIGSVVLVLSEPAAPGGAAAPIPAFEASP